jgi:hypothetical protein
LKQWQFVLQRLRVKTIFLPLGENAGSDALRAIRRLCEPSARIVQASVFPMLAALARA